MNSNLQPNENPVEQSITPAPEKSSAPAVVRATRILDLLAQTATPMSLAQLSRLLDVPKSSLHGLCNTLTQLRLISRADNGQMTLGPHVMTWANAFLARSDITQEFFAAWDEFGGLPQETVTLSVLDGDNVVYIACKNGTRPLGVTFRIGMRLPAPYTATGKAILSTLPEDEVRSLFNGAWPMPMTAAGTPSLDAFMQEISEVRARGYSIDAGEVRDGMHCLGAPVFDSSGKRAVAGVAISILSHEINAASESTAGNAIRNFADRLSERLGGARGA
jgi:IclR family transcriptional regulator, blcABC operon repressor